MSLIIIITYCTYSTRRTRYTTHILLLFTSSNKAVITFISFTHQTVYYSDSFIFSLFGASLPLSLSFSPIPLPPPPQLNTSHTHTQKHTCSTIQDRSLRVERVLPAAMIHFMWNTHTDRQQERNGSSTVTRTSQCVCVCRWFQQHFSQSIFKSCNKVNISEWAGFNVIIQPPIRPRVSQEHTRKPTQHKSAFLKSTLFKIESGWGSSNIPQIWIKHIQNRNEGSGVRFRLPRLCFLRGASGLTLVSGSAGPDSAASQQTRLFPEITWL